LESGSTALDLIDGGARNAVAQFNEGRWIFFENRLPIVHAI
jgi:hypothetical protein